MKVNHLVNTSEPYRIDVHQHILPEFYLEIQARVGKTTTFGVTLPDWPWKRISR
jgi:hypothetical protein